jgi:hypothetical protein
LAQLGWGSTELASRRKSDPAKLALAARLRRETTLTTKQIAARLWLGTPKSATTVLHRWMRKNPPISNPTRSVQPSTGGRDAPASGLTPPPTVIVEVKLESKAELVKVGLAADPVAVSPGIRDRG